MKFFRTIALSVIVVISACSRHDDGNDPRFVFDQMSMQVRNIYFDPEFNGYDWEEVERRFRDEASSAADSHHLYYDVIIPMLGLLESSHTTAAPPSNRAGAADRGHRMAGQPILAGRCQGIAVGVDDPGRSAIVDAVVRGGRAWARGVRPGWRIVGPSEETATGYRMPFVDRSGQSRTIEFAVGRSPPVDVYRGWDQVAGDPTFHISALGISGRRGLLRRSPQIVHVAPASRAFAAGLRAGDVISSISQGRLPSGETRFAIGVRHLQDGRTIGFNDVRRCADPGDGRNLSVRRLGDGVTYVRFDHFVAGSAGNDIRDAVRSAARSSRTLVLDLRWNSGGDSANTQSILAELLPVGHRYTIGHMVARRGSKSIEVDGSRAGDLKIYVLTTMLTESAGEVSASALRRHANATIIGDITAGSVQFSRNYQLADMGVLQIAFAQFVDDRGQVLEGVGVEPDIRARQSDGQSIPIPEHGQMLRSVIDQM